MSSEIITSNDLKAILDEVLAPTLDVKMVTWNDGSRTIAASNAITRDNIDISSVIPSGYKPIGAIMKFAGSYLAICYSSAITDSGKLTYQLANRGSSSLTLNPIFQILCVRHSYANLDNHQADYIVEQGISGIWTYRKWSSGIAECWGQTSVASTTYSANGGYKNIAEDLPSGLFNATPSVVIASGKINTCVGTTMGFTAPNSASSVQTYLVNRGGSSVTQAGSVFWEVKGTWK